MADVAGSTSIAERLGPERAKFLFDEVQRLMAAEVRALDGTVAQLMGDGMLALFGAPLAHEDDPERAGRAALAIRDAVAGYARDVLEAYEVELALRQGVNTGPVVVSADVQDGHQRYNALGDTVNVAARLQALADPGQIVVGEATARLMEACLAVEPLGEQALKGRTVPVQAFSLRGEVEPMAHDEGRLVGRDYELAVLERAMDDVAEGRGIIVALTGEPGIGKTRLAKHVQGEYGDRIRFLEGRAVDYASSTPFAPIAEVLRRWLGVSGHGPEARTRLELRAQLAALFDDGDADRLYPLLATIMGLTLEPDVAARLRSVSREAVQEHTFVAVCELLQKLSDERPACLMLEDLHWADDATLELVERLLDTTEEASVGIMLLYRAEREHPSWHLGETARQRYPHRYREIELRPLGQKASRELALDRAGAELPDGVVKQLAERSGGNPFFLEAALRDLQESGALRLEDGRWTLADGDVSIPAQVRSVLQARLDRLGPDTREVIQLGAVIGRSFDLDLLRALLPGRPLTRSLAELQRLDLIVEEARRPSPTYRFRHGLVQEVAYGTLVDARRKELHGKVGAALEETCGREGETLAALARHFSEADDAPRAAKYLLAAGDAARSVAADRDALHNYRLARRFLARLGDDQRMRETLFKIALVHHLAFDYAGAEEAYDAAFCCRVEDEKPGPPPTEHLHLSCSRPEGIVPGHVYSTDGASFVFSLFRGLLRVEEDMSVMPELAENFRVSSDGLTYLFQLRDGLRWSDGEPLTAEDFVYTWQCMREQQLVTSFFLEDVASAEALDDVTLEVRLHEPRNAFLYLLASPWSFPWPKHRVERDPEGWSAPEQLVGNGPFALAEWDDKHAVLRANPMWLLPRGNVVQIDASFHDTEMQVALWQEGEFDVAPGWHGDIDIDPEQIHETAPYSTRFLGMRVDGPLGDSRLRRAIAQAINRSTLFRQLRRTPSSRHGGAIPPGVPGHSPNIAPHHDLDEARRLLAEAGYPDGEGLRELVLEHNESYRESVDELARQLGELGIRVVARRRGRRGFDPERPTAEADLWAEGWSADFPDPDGFFRGLIDWRFRPVVERVPEITRVFEQARSLTQHDERLKLYQQVDRMLVSELAVLVPLAYPRSTYLVRPWVHAIEITPITLGQFDRVVIDGEARDRASRDRTEEGEPAAAP